MNGKCGLNWKYGLNWGELTEDKYLILNGNLMVSAPTVRRRCSYPGEGNVYSYISATQNQGSGFYQLGASTSLAFQNGIYCHAFFYFTGLDLTKYKKVVLKTNGVSANNNETYLVEILSGVTNTLITEEVSTVMPTISPSQTRATSSGMVTTEFDISSVTGGYLIIKLAPAYQANVSINIVDLYLVEK